MRIFMVKKKVLFAVFEIGTGVKEGIADGV